MKSFAPEYIKQARLLRRTKDWKVTTSIITYELGAVIKNLFYADKKPALAQGHRAWAQSEIMDVIAQVECLCQDMHWDFDELRTQGAEKFYGRMKEMSDAQSTKTS